MRRYPVVRYGIPGRELQNVDIGSEEFELLAQNGHALIVARDMGERHRVPKFLMGKCRHARDQIGVETFRHAGGNERLVLRNHRANRGGSTACRRRSRAPVSL